MRHMLFLMVVLVVGIAMLAAVGQSAQAQEPVPVVVPSCQDMVRYDLNRDGRSRGMTCRCGSSRCTSWGARRVS